MKSPTRLHRKSSHGIALIELVIAMSVLLIIFPPALMVFYQVMNERFRNEARVVAVYLAQGIVENLSQRRFSTISDIHALPVGIPPEPVQFSAEFIGPGVQNPFWTGLDESGDPKFTQYSYQVIVDCVTYGLDPNNRNIDTWAVDPPCTDPVAQDYRRVVVKVFFENFETITLTTLMADLSDPGDP